MSAPSPGLKILMTTGAIGGVWVFATTLARELCCRGARVTLVTLGPPPREHELWAFNGVEGLDFEITDIALEWMDPEGLDVPRAQFRLAALERRIKPDIVHLNGYREACVRWHAPMLAAAHSCIQSWSVAVRGSEPAEERWKRYVSDVQCALAGADLWVAPTHAFRDTVQALYAPPSRGRVVWNGIESLTPESEKEPFILAAGRLWDEAKNLKLLTGIAGELPWPLRIAGASRFPGTEVLGSPGTTAERIGELYRPQLLALMDKAAVFAACPFYEPFGVSILEAAASGCALVLSDIPTLRELWDGAAIFADPNDPDAFREALRRICEEREVREALQGAARARAERYSLRAMADRYGDLYRELLARARDDARAAASLAEARVGRHTPKIRSGPAALA
jgi:glycosyltransferase involved in cell wall biosynthesis